MAEPTTRQSRSRCTKAASRAKAPCGFKSGAMPRRLLSGISWSYATQYDNGYNVRVAADLDTGPSNTSATVVEVHRSGNRPVRPLVPRRPMTLGPSPSISWGPKLEINSGMNQGYAPTVSVANNLAVLVAQGSGGALWYALGTVDTTTQSITWTDPIPYSTTGYNPTVSVFGDGSSSYLQIPAGWVVVEAHQADNTTGSLTYRTGLLNGASPTSITWTPDADTTFATGCYPSIAIAFYGDTLHRVWA